MAWLFRANGSICLSYNTFYKVLRTGNSDLALKLRPVSNIFQDTWLDSEDPNRQSTDVTTRAYYIFTYLHVVNKLSSAVMASREKYIRDPK